MNDTELILNALGQVPDLVEAAKTYKETNDKTVSTLSTAIKERPKAVIPQKEVEKVTAAVKLTPCALPDTGDFLKAIAALLRPIIHQEVKEAVGATKIKIQHEHRHDHYSYSASFAIPADRNSYHRHRSFDEQRNVSRQKIYGNVRFGAPDQKRKGAVYQRFIYGVALSKSLQRLP